MNELQDITGYDGLRIGIVEQAIKDYRKALKRNDNCEIYAIEKFFKGAWFLALTRGRIDGSFIINEIRREYENEKNNKRNEYKRTKEVNKKRNK